MYEPKKKNVNQSIVMKTFHPNMLVHSQTVLLRYKRFCACSEAHGSYTFCAVSHIENFVSVPTAHYEITHAK